MKKTKLGYLVSGQGRLFQKVLEFSRSDLSAFEISCVLADRNCPAAEYAKKQGIPSIVLNYSEYKEPIDFHKELYEQVMFYAPDFLLLNYNRLVKSPLLEKFHNKIINIHYSILPAYKGFNAIKKAYKNGNKLIGVTAHFIDESMDGGPIIAQNIGPILINDTLDDVEISQFRRVVPITIQCCQWFAEGKISVQNNRVKVLTNSFQEKNLMYPPIDPKISGSVS